MKEIILPVYIFIFSIFLAINNYYVSKEIKSLFMFILRNTTVLLCSALWPLTWWITLLVWFALKTNHEYNKTMIIGGVSLAMSNSVFLIYLILYFKY